MSLISDLWNFVIEQLNRIIRFINSVSIRATEGLNDLIRFVNGFYDRVNREIRGIWSWIEYLKGQITTGVTEAVASAIRYAKEAVMSVIGTIQTQISSIYDNIREVYNWVSRQIANLENFLLRKIQEAFDAIIERVNKVEEALTKVPDTLTLQSKVLDWVLEGIVKAWR